MEEPYINQYPSNSIISVITFVGAHQLEPGLLEHYMPFNISFGNGRHLKHVSLHQDSQNISDFEFIIVKSGINYQITDNMKFDSWNKAQFNGTLSVISVLSGGLTLQEVLLNPRTRELVDTAISEIGGLAKRVLGEEFPSWLPTVETHHSMILNNPIPYKPSLLIDFERGKSMEFESILGNILRSANKLNYSMPICKANYALLKALDAINIKEKMV